MDIEELLTLPYQLKIEEEPSEGGFYASYPQLPGGNAFGGTREEAIESVKKAKRKWLEMAVCTGIDIPMPNEDDSTTVGALYQKETIAGRAAEDKTELAYSSRVAMYGAILGDMIGAPYEFDQGEKTKDFILFDRRKWIHYTDDTAMTLAIAKAIMKAGPGAGEGVMKAEMISCMQDFGNRFAEGEYGDRFIDWLREKDPQPYGSYGNGAAMRVSAIGWFYDSMERTREVARWSAENAPNMLNLGIWYIL